MSGWIKTWRSLEKWEWYSSPNCTQVFIDILIRANFEDGKYRGVFIPRGSLTTSRSKIAKRTGLTEQQVRTVLNKLISTNEITISTTKSFTMISITNWDSYQGDNQETNQQITRKVTSESTSVSTTSKKLRTKEDKNIPGLFEVEPLQLETDIEASGDAITVLTMLNTICFRAFRPTDFNLKFINARLKEKYTIPDFKKVIECKNKDWGDKPEWKHLLQPSTLFGNKFDQYLNQAIGSETMSQAEEDALIAKFFPGA